MKNETNINAPILTKQDMLRLSTRRLRPTPQAQQPTISYRARRIDEYVELESKSPAAAFWLALLFGPIGYLYASPLGGVIGILIALIGAGTGFIPFLVWIFCVFNAAAKVGAENRKIRAKAEAFMG